MFLPKRIDQPTSSDDAITSSGGDIEPEPKSSVRKVRSLREIYDSCDVTFFASESQNFDEAAKEEVWQKAMDEEIASIEKNHTWDLVDLL
ncbi:UNVERIFIED_CONTAM: hypothetical protein Scaly_2036100 [Sesamum calycinum]|uniref:Uncharacterized protein n=1 Tax=Sesamum calycinum TaxID=2727403 RepID=A0AAW2N2F7_9LAMI